MVRTDSDLTQAVYHFCWDFFCRHGRSPLHMEVRDALGLQRQQLRSCLEPLWETGHLVKGSTLPVECVAQKREVV